MNQILGKLRNHVQIICNANNLHPDNQECNVYNKCGVKTRQVKI
jgi:hypothetical protein